MTNFFLSVWEGFEYIEEREQYLEVHTFTAEDNEIEMQCLTDLLLQTKIQMDKGNGSYFNDIARKHIDENGLNYLVSKNSIQQVYPDNFMINTLSPKNEVIQIPSNPNQIWLLSPLSEA